MRSHSLEKAQGSLSSQGRFHSCVLYLIFPRLSEDSEGFAGRSLDFPQYLPHPFLAGADMRFDAVNIRYVVSGPDKQCVVLQYSKVAQRWLIFEQRRNVSGGTGRIPQSCATRSLLRQESDASLGIRCCLCCHPILLPVSLFLLILPCLSLNLSSFFPSFLHFFFNLSCNYESQCAQFFSFLYFPCIFFLLILSSLLAPARRTSFLH